MEPGPVPMSLARRVLPWTSGRPGTLLMSTPWAALPEMTLPPPAIASPMVLFDDWTRTPCAALSRMKFPWIRLPVPVEGREAAPGSFWSETPTPLPAITLRRPGVFPPTRLFDQERSRPSPLARLPPEGKLLPTVGAGKAPRKLPHSQLPCEPAPVTAIPAPLNPVTIRPETMQLAVSISRPSTGAAAGARVLPSTWTMSAAISTADPEVGLAEEPGWV